MVRAARIVPRWNPTPLPEVVPSWVATGAVRGWSGVSPSMLVSTATGLVGAVVMAMVFHQPLMMAFAAIGALTSVGTMVAHWVSVRRHRRVEQRRDEQAAHQAREAGAEHRRAWRAYLTGTVGTLADTLNSTDRWQRRALHDDAFTVALGIGEGPVAASGPGVEAGEGFGGRSSESSNITERLADVPVGVTLAPGAVVGVSGGFAPHVVRSLIVQLAMRTGPADWRLVVVPADPHAWEWVQHLPHGRDTEGLPAVFDDVRLASYVAALHHLTN